MLTQRQKFVKRLFDLFITIIALPVLMFPILTFILIATIDTSKFGLFAQERVGVGGKTFKIFKIRTLLGSGHDSIIMIKKNETRFGSWLRRTKLDELPQLINVLIGDMSWVGPRPDVKGYADKLEANDRIILLVRPGLTGPATLKYKNEDDLLLAKIDPNEYNDTVIWPDKVKINKDYIKNWSLIKDIKYITASFR